MDINSVEIIAGDDFTRGVDFYDEEDQPFVLSKGDKCELIIHISDGSELVIGAKSLENNSVVFYVPGKLTRELCKSDVNIYQYCIRLNLQNGSQFTPIHREKLIIKRC